MKHLALVVAAVMPLVAAVTDVDKSKTFGSAAAPVTIEVFSDFQCPACKQLNEQTLPLLMKDYAVPGKVYLVHREMPLNGHKYSREAAHYATAAGRIGKYQAVADSIFKAQVEWSVSGKVWDAAAKVLAPAEQAKVQALAKDPAVTSEVEREYQMAMAAGINQTPTMIITRGAKRYPLSGMALNYNLLRSLIDDLLK